MLRGGVRHWPIVQQARVSPLAASNYLHKLDNGTPVQAILIPPGVDRRVFYQADLRGVNIIRNKLPIAAIIEQVPRYWALPNPPSVAVQSALLSDCLPGFLDAHTLPLLAARPSPRIWLGKRRRAEIGPRDNPAGIQRYFASNLISSCAQPDTGDPFDAVSGR
jgi:hypothetical protein